MVKYRQIDVRIDVVSDQYGLISRIDMKEQPAPKGGGCPWGHADVAKPLCTQYFMQIGMHECVVLVKFSRTWDQFIQLQSFLF